MNRVVAFVRRREGFSLSSRNSKAGKNHDQSDLSKSELSSSRSALNSYHNLLVLLSFPTNWNIFAGTKSGTGKLQVRHAAQSDAGIAGMAATTFGRHAHYRSNAGTQVANYQQSGLGKSVSWNWKLRIANVHDRRDSTITDNGTCPIESLVESEMPRLPHRFHPYT